MREHESEEEGPTGKRVKTEPEGEEGPAGKRVKTEPEGEEGPAGKRVKTEPEGEEGPAGKRVKTEPEGEEEPAGKRVKTEPGVEAAPLPQRWCVSSTMSITSTWYRLGPIPHRPHLLYRLIDSVTSQFRCLGLLRQINEIRLMLPNVAYCWYSVTLYPPRHRCGS
jgi:hypothetical protein